MAYQIKYEYRENGKLRRVYAGTVFEKRKDAENQLSEDLDNLKSKGCTDVQGDVVEIKG